MIQQPIPGDVLPNGATLVAVKHSETFSNGWLALCINDKREYVTWFVNHEGECFWGHYHSIFIDAVNDFKKRT